MEKTKENTLAQNLAELASVELQLAQVRIAQFRNATKKVINSKMDGMDKYIDIQAKKYNQNKEKANGIRDDYKERLKEIQSEYEQQRNLLLQSKCDFEIVELIEIGKITQTKMLIKAAKDDPKETKAYEMVKLARKELDTAMKERKC